MAARTMEVHRLRGGLGRTSPGTTLDEARGVYRIATMLRAHCARRRTTVERDERARQPKGLGKFPVLWHWRNAAEVKCPGATERRFSA